MGREVFRSVHLLSKRSSREDFVTKNDCNRQHAKIDLALFGVDGRGGMVKDVADIKNFMHEQAARNIDEKQDAKDKKATALKWKLTAVASLFGLAGIVLGFILNKI